MQCPICNSTHIKHEHGAPVASCENCKYDWVLQSALPALRPPPTQDPGTDIPMTFKEWLAEAGVEPNGNDPRVSLARLAWDAATAAARHGS